jgi:hypothetical protein
MQRIASLLVALAALVPAAAASAQPVLAVEAPPPPRGDRRTEVDIGYIVGGGGIGTESRFQRGVTFAIGRRFGDLALLGEYDYLAVGRHEATGSMNRVGLLARYSLLRTRGGPGDRPPLSGDTWLEAGGGYQRIAWDEGGTLRRPDLVLGFGTQLDAVFRRDSDEPTWFGPFVAFRAVLAQGPALPADVSATCGGPCDQASRPSRNDVALFFHFGLNWGR